MVKRTLAERAREVAECEQCAVFLVRCTAGKTASHRVFDRIEQFHVNGHASNEVTPRPFKKTSGSASKAFTAPPSSATEETHKFQSIFLKVVEDYLPANDKLNPLQQVVLNKDVTMTVLQRVGASRCCFRPTKVYGEEQARPTVSAFVEGIVSLIAGDEEVSVACECPVRYFVKTTDENGIEVITEEGATGQDELLSGGLSHDDRKGKTWKKDFILYSAVKALDQHGSTKTVMVPRVHVESKGDAASIQDLYQASANGWKLQLKRLQEKEIIGRLYIEVWGTICHFYGIQDILGYVTVDRGVVMPESFVLYQQTVEKYRMMWGAAFPEESFLRCPQSLSEMQSLYDDIARDYQDKWKQPLPSMQTMENFPVGVVYLNLGAYAFPSGKLAVNFEHAARFIQGHVRILAGNWVIPNNPAAYADANSRLLENHRKYMEEKAKAEVDKMIDSHQGPAPELPERVIFRSWAEAGVTQLAGQAGKSVITTGEASSSSSAGDFLESPPSRAVVGGWTNDDVKQLVRATCGADAAVDEALAASEIDGPLLLAMSSSDLDLWFTEICLQRMAPRMRIKSWLDSVRRT